jgi:hypothetical protein
MCIAVLLGVIYDSLATNRKQRGLPVRPPSSAALLVLYIYKYTKVPPQTGGSSYILIKKSPKTAFLK